MKMQYKKRLLTFVEVVFFITFFSALCYAQPVVDATSSGKQVTTSATHAITLPTCAAGKLLMVVFSIDGTLYYGRSSLSVSAGTNWTQLGFRSDSATISSAVYWKVAEGGDALTLTVDPIKTSSHVAYCFSNATGISGTPAIGSSTNSDPPNYATGLTNRNILWVAARSGDSNVIASAAPAGYSALVQIQATNTSGTSTDTAYLATANATQNPGAFTSVTEQWVAWTIAVFEDTNVVTVSRPGGTFASGTPGSVAWTNPSNAGALDNTATIAAGLANTVSATLSATNFGFAIPADAVVDGIQLKFVRNFQTGSGAGQVDDSSIKLLNSGVAVGSNYANLFYNYGWYKGAATSGYYTAFYGDAGDKWGATWTAADINSSTFGVAVQAVEIDDDPRDTRIDYLELSVRYLADVVVPSGPQPTIASAAANPTNTSPIPITIEFDEDVTGFAVGDLTVGNGSAGNFVAVDGNSYTADITPSGQGAVTVNISAGVAQNASLEDNFAATQFSRVYDSVAPTVSLSSAATSSTNSSPFSVTFQFSETVTGFAVGDITVGNGSAGSFVAVDGDTYTANITPSGQGTVTVDVAGSVAQDTAGNNNSAATQLTRTFDSVAPTVTISSAASNPTNSSPFSVTFQFSETVTGFVVGDITVGNGSKSNFVAVDGDTYTVDITPSGQGAVTVDVAGSVAQDSAGNNNTSATQLSRTYDSGVPTVTISSAASNPTNSSPFSVTFQFSETVTGFAVGDITVGNGNAGNFAAVDGDTYTADITPSGQGAVTVDVAGSVAQDTAGNNNSAASQLTRTYDSTAPTVTISSAAADPTNSSPFSVTFQFSETVTGFAVGDITVGNGSAGTFVAVDGDTYTANITPTGQGAVTVDVAGSVAQDTAGNNNTAAAQLTRTYDSSAPTLTISSTTTAQTNSSPIDVTFEFSETVTGFVVGDISVVNGSKSNFVAIDGDTYTVDITPSGQGAVTIDVAGSVAQDAAGNNNTAAAQITRIYDTVAPTVTISSAASDPTNSSPFLVTIQFNETVTGFAVGDITVGNGSAGSFIAVDGDTYTANITPSAQGSVTVDVAGSVAQDAAGNDNSAAAQFTRTYDSAAPTIVITSSESSPTSMSPIPIAIEFSEVVTGFVIGDVTVGNGSKSNFVAVDGDSYTLDVTPSGQGAVTVDIAGSVAQDASGNNNTAATQFSINYDSAVPTVVITSSAASPTNDSPIPITIQFSETVTGFVIGDIAVGNGVAGNFVAVDGDTYTADITPSGEGAVTVDVAGSVAQDSAGNNNSAATQFSITYDTTVPTVAITSSASSPTKNSPIAITVQFSETVAGFAIGDLSVGNGSAGSFVAVDGDTYTANITPSGQGAVTVDIAGSVAQDGAGNNNTAATQFSIVYDSTAPTVVISSSESSPTKNAPIPITMQFSETVNGFAIGDLAVGNGAAGNFVAVDGDTYTADITPTGQGAVTVNIAGAAAQDAATNNSAIATQFSITYDTVAPTVAVTSNLSSPTSTSPIPVTIEFSENVSGFVVGDITVGNGTAGNFVAVDGNTYTSNITPSGEGSVTVNIDPAVAQDAATNSNTAAAQFSITYSTTAPSVTISSTAISPSKSTSIPLVIQFSEAVTGFTVGDIVAANGTLGGFVAVNTTTYTVNLIPSGQGAVTVNIAGAVAQDTDGNGNIAASQFSISHDSVAPTVVLSTTTTNPTQSSQIALVVQFSESVSGFAANDIVVTNATLSNFVAVNATKYTAKLTPTGTGNVTARVAAGAALDSASNSNSASNTLSVSYANQDVDTDGDTLMDDQEALDGTDPEDAGSFLAILGKSFCSEWNGFLGGMYNVMEFVNLSNADRRIRVTLYSFEGEAKSSSELLITPGGQQDMLVHDMEGWIADSYGKVCAEVLNGQSGDVDGRMSYYKPNSEGGFDFAFAMPYQNGLKGSQFVMFNTFQPSLDSSDSENVVTNWIQVTNLEAKTASGTLYYYGQDGIELASEKVTLPAGARRDFSGHQFGKNLVGMIEWRPSSNANKFSVRNVRYFYDNQLFSEMFDAAFQLEGQKGNGREMTVALDTRSGSAVLEVANTLANEVSVQVKIRGADGSMLAALNFSLPARGSVHIITDAILNGTFGSATVKGSQKQSLIATAMHYGRTASSGISYLYGVNAAESLGTVMRGSYNTFLNQSCEVLLVNGKSHQSSLTMNMRRYDDTAVLEAVEFTLPSRGALVVDACAYENQAAYGVITVQPEDQNDILATMIRVGAADSYRFPTPIRQ